MWALKLASFGNVSDALSSRCGGVLVNTYSRRYPRLLTSSYADMEYTVLYLR